MVVVFTTTYAISAYHQLGGKFESRSWLGVLVQHYMIKFVSELRHVGGFLLVLWFPPPIKLTLIIIEDLIKLVVCTKVYIYGFITITGLIPLLVDY